MGVLVETDVSCAETNAAARAKMMSEDLILIVVSANLNLLFLLIYIQNGKSECAK
jgi:hypothetical protein